MARGTDLSVFITHSDATCDECGEDLGRRAWITLNREKGALCLACADMEHLVFLPAGDAALTHRSRKHSSLVAVVLRWSRARKRYERQGLLVEEAALAQAEQECLADEEARARQRERAAERRAELDHEYVERFAARVRELFPSRPAGREVEIAEHACLKTAAASAARRQPSGWKRTPSASPWLPTSAMLRRTMTSYWAAASSGTKHAPR